ncbi:MAG TPA: hypothetical protein VM344_02960 [Vitreimonas sp.]|nr:hypothetical protein [Vitreimonas sp.]
MDLTPHGPTEEADIVSAHLNVEGRPVLAGLVIKGKAWRTVKRRDVWHQILRAAQLQGVGLLVVAAVGDIQDDIKRDLAFLGGRLGVDWLLLDRGDLARLLAAYRQLCPNDGTWMSGRPCPVCVYGRAPVRARRLPSHVLTLEDVSFAGAKRYGAHILLPPGLSEVEVEARTAAAVEEIRRSLYTRNEQVERLHGGRDADVVFLFVYEDIADRPFANWICRTLWISPDLDERWHPTLFGQPISHPSLRLEWSASYEVIAELLAQKQDKATYLVALDSFLASATEIVDDARGALAEGPLTPEREARLRTTTGRIDALPRPDGMKAPPHELAELDSVFSGLDGDLTNLSLPSRRERRKDVARAGTTPSVGEVGGRGLGSRLRTAATAARGGQVTTWTTQSNWTYDQLGGARLAVDFGQSRDRDAVRPSLGARPRPGSVYSAIYMVRENADRFLEEGFTC